jgi:hypothetical protein
MAEAEPQHTSWSVITGTTKTHRKLRFLEIFNALFSSSMETEPLSVGICSPLMNPHNSEVIGLTVVG